MKTHGEVRLRTAFDMSTCVKRQVWDISATPDIMIRIKRIFPRARTGRTVVVSIDHTVEIARDLEWVLDRWPMQISDADRAFLNAGADDHRRREEVVLQILSGERPHHEYREPARKPREYQLIAAELALTTGALLLADDLGLGKSMSATLVLRESSLLPALVVCPTHLPSQWAQEIAETLPWLKTHIITKGEVYNPATTRDMKGEEPDVLITNYHKIKGWADHLAGIIKAVIFDEAQELRRSESEKYNAATRVSFPADVVMGLTATPVYNYAGEIWNIFNAIAPDRLGSREEFAREWGASGQWNNKMRVRDPRALGTFLRNEGLMLRRTRQEVGRELPDVVRVHHAVDADETLHERLMAGVVDLARTILEGSRQEAFKAEGEIDWKMRHATGVSKARYVADFVRLLLESEERVVLFGWHRDVYSIWEDRLADFNPAFYTGSESARKKNQSKDAFLRPVTEKGASRILIMSLRSGSGLDGLQEVCKVAVFGELDWSPGQHDQCIGRLHRDGQLDNVLAYFLVSNMGSDPVIADVLNEKRMQSEPLRDPDAELFEARTQADRVRKLAESVLAKRESDDMIPSSKVYAAI